MVDGELRTVNRPVGHPEVVEVNLFIGVGRVVYGAVFGRVHRGHNIRMDTFTVVQIGCEHCDGVVAEGYQQPVGRIGGGPKPAPTDVEAVETGGDGVECRHIYHHSVDSGDGVGIKRYRGHVVLSTADDCGQHKAADQEGFLLLSSFLLCINWL